MAKERGTRTCKLHSPLQFKITPTSSLGEMTTLTYGRPLALTEESDEECFVFKRKSRVRSTRTHTLITLITKNPSQLTDFIEPIAKRVV